VRIQKALAEAGLGSRREIEGWIAEGRIKVNGQLAKLGEKIVPTDRVQLDGRPVRLRAHRDGVRIIAYNKPAGELVTRQDPKGRPIVFARLPKLDRGRWIAVGRLDINTTGLLLLTNSGELANRLMHPSREVEREYAVRVLGEVPGKALYQLTHGVELDDGPARFEEIVDSGGSGANRWYHVVLREGRNREVRRLWEAVGLRVSRLKRVRYGNVILGADVSSRHWRELSAAEVDGLLELAGMKSPGTSARRLSKGQDPLPRHPGRRNPPPRTANRRRGS
jgi:23S rRNA pseudouridine2605 synthase